MRDYKPVRLDANLLQLPTSCVACWIHVGHSDRDDDWKWVEIALFSPHVAHERALWTGVNGRLRRAWRALRGDPEPWLDFYSKAELDAFREAVDEAAAVVFSAAPNPPA
jgi:hypothetical protein